MLAKFNTYVTYIFSNIYNIIMPYTSIPLLKPIGTPLEYT